MKCLVILKHQTEISEREKRLIQEIEKYCEVEIADPSIMMKNQTVFIGSKYLAIVTLGGDGTVLKAVSICTRKSSPVKNAQYIDCTHSKLESLTVWVDKIERDSAFAREDTLLPVVFSFDNGVRGRMCSIKKEAYEEGYKLLIELMVLMKKENFKLIDEFYANKTIRRSRILVNRSIHSLNEVYVYTKGKGFLCGINVYLGSKIILSNFRCDGLIISTGTGSSGYNASAGGPIIYTGVDVIAVTAVAADKKFSPFVIDLQSQEISVRNSIENQEIFGIIDGCMKISGSEIVVTRSSQGAVYFADPSPEKEYNDFLSVIQG